MNAIETIAKELAPFFAEQDGQIAEGDVAWALDRANALREFKKSEEYKILNAKGELGGKYQKLWAICGGKTWYSVFNGNSISNVEAFMRKNAAATAKKRNQSIAAKLAKAGVETVNSAEVVYCTDGFDGIFTVNDTMRVKIQSIVAGGHTIQRLHQRVLVNVKGA
jgi:hypothetical protein